MCGHKIRLHGEELPGRMPLRCIAKFGTFTGLTFAVLSKRLSWKHHRLSGCATLHRPLKYECEMHDWQDLHLIWWKDCYIPPTIAAGAPEWWEASRIAVRCIRCVGTGHDLGCSIFQENVPTERKSGHQHMIQTHNRPASHTMCHVSCIIP